MLLQFAEHTLDVAIVREAAMVVIDWHLAVRSRRDDGQGDRGAVIFANLGLRERRAIKVQQDDPGLKADLRVIRARGFAITRGVVTQGVLGAAVPVFRSYQTLDGSLGLILCALLHKTRMQLCPAYISGLIGQRPRKSDPHPKRRIYPLFFVQCAHHRPQPTGARRCERRYGLEASCFKSASQIGR